MKLYKATEEQIAEGICCGKCRNFSPVVKAVNGTSYDFCYEHKTGRLREDTVEIHNTSEWFVCYRGIKFERA